MSGEEDWIAKLDPALRRLVRRAQASGGEERVSLLLQVTGPLDELVPRGLVLGNQAGDVVLAEAPLSAVPHIARHPAVVSVEVSRGLHLDR